MTCFCLGPPGDCPCIRGARKAAAMTDEQYKTALWLRDLSKPRIRVKAGSQRITCGDELADQCEVTVSA